MLCSISGNETNDAVVSPKSGGIFDRKLAQAYISTLGKDPLNDEPMTVDELITIATNGVPVLTPPKPAEFHSIPTMLQAFQNEWDALALEVFSLRKQLHSTRQELSIALYQYDAAVRVAAAATREKEEAQLALQQVSEAFASKAGKNGEAGADARVSDKEQHSSQQNEGLHHDVDFALIISLAREHLFTLHKQLKVSLPVTTKSTAVLLKTEEDLKTKSAETLLIDSESSQKIITGRSFGTLCLPEAKKHTALDAVAFLHKSGQATPIGIKDDEWLNLTSGQKYPIDTKNVRFLVTHPSEPYFVAVSDTGKLIVIGEKRFIQVSELLFSTTAADFHVDGALVGIACSSKVDIVDLTTLGVVSSIETPGLRNITSIKFAMNGYWLVVSGAVDDAAGAVRIYDLRKNSLVHAFQTSGNSEFAIDPSCQVLVICDQAEKKLSVHLYAKKGKKWIENTAAEDCGDLHSLQIESSLDDVLLSKEVKIAGLSGNSLAHYTIRLDGDKAD